MTQMIGYCGARQEEQILIELCREIAAMYDIQNWHGQFVASEESFLLKCQQETPDMLCLSVVSPSGTETAQSARRACANAQMLLIADETVAPTRYLRPSIRAAALLLRPFSKNEAQRALSELLAEWYGGTEQDSRHCFIVRTKQESRKIPYPQIMFFEARERRIFLYTQSESIAFYDTLENLQQALPRTFLRCHKGYIVNTTQIRNIRYSDNEIQLWDDSRLPISRSYRNDVKALMP